MSSYVDWRSRPRLFSVAIAITLFAIAVLLSMSGLKVSTNEDAVAITSYLQFKKVDVPRAFVREAILSALTVNTWFFSNEKEERRFRAYGHKDALTIEKAVQWRFEKTRSNLKNFSESYCELSQLMSATKPCANEKLAKLNELIAAIHPDFESQINITAINLVLKELVDDLIETNSNEFFLKSVFRNTTVYRVLASFLHQNNSQSFTLIPSPSPAKSGAQSDGFAIGTTLVTQAEWFEVMGYNPSFFQAERHCPESFLIQHGVSICPFMPVESVSWEQVNHFLKRKNYLDPQFKFRLPSPEEWEVAARGGGNTPYFFGETDQGIDKFSWYLKNSGLQTHDVAKKLPNAFGLYDITGNVWQLVDGPLDAITTYAPGQRLPSSLGYMIRGGSWIDSSEGQRISVSSKIFDDWLCYDVGFRLVREPRSQ